MLSILIPIYNFAVKSLVRELQKQCLGLNISFEILCFDDGSLPEYKDINRELKGGLGVIYYELPRNLGRAAIRNHLADQAKYPYLLFMDGDSGVIKQDYIKHYIANLAEGGVLYGGRVYNDAAPKDRTLYLHWLFGRAREQKPVGERRINPYHSFMTNNFLMPQALFQRIGFDEKIIGYGHEDTLFGMELLKKNIPVIHLNNPLEHLGLETSVIFLEKQAQAILNLWELHQRGLLIETRLLQTFHYLQKSGFLPLTRWTLGKMAPYFFRNLLSQHPSLFIFDLYKLHLLLQIAAV